MRGAVGLRTDVLGSEHLDLLRKKLTLTSVPYKDQAPTVVQSFHEDDGYFWIPRYYNHLDFWPKIKHWEWTTPKLNYTLQSNFTADPKRKQPEAIAALEQHLRTHSGGIGICPTGLGKTYLTLEIARRFNTPIGILIYSGHMIDNWVQHCRDHLGIPDGDIGLIKENRCDIGKPVTIISIQTVLARDLPKAALHQFGFIAADELHRYGAARWGKVIGKFPARYRLGVSANPVRDDGLDPIIRWNFGKVGYSLYQRPTGELPLVCMVRYPTEYSKRKYYDWQKIRGKWTMTTPNFQKYAKLLMKDSARNEWLVDKLVDARRRGRRVLVFAHHRDHIKKLHDRFVVKWKAINAIAQASVVGGNSDKTTTALLWGGLKDRERKKALLADIMFTTHGFAREALNVTHIDTLIFATPPGDPLQPAGRLRDKGPTDRKSLLIVDPFENGDYPFKKAQRRKRAYEDLGMSIKRITTKLK